MLADDQTAREAYDKLRAEHGFRMTDYKTDNEATPPRLCLQFSEDLARTQTRRREVRLRRRQRPAEPRAGRQAALRRRPEARRALSSSDPRRTAVRSRRDAEQDRRYRRLCAGPLGVRALHRQSLRAAQRAASRAFRSSRPTRSKIDVEIYRIGDRNLPTTLQSGDFQRQLSSYDIDNIRDKSGIKVYAGDMDIAAKLNEEVTTAVPVTDATGKLEPGAYVMVAKPSEKSKNDDGQRATQWFIVSDLGLTAFSGNDGIHAFVRSLADATPIADSQRQARRPQQRSAGHRQDRRQGLRQIRRRHRQRRRRHGPRHARR